MEETKEIKETPPPAFVETPEMRTLKALLTPETSREAFRVSLSQYQQMAEEQIDELDDNLRGRAQIELIIATAKIYAQAGRDNTEVIEDALAYASGHGDWDLADQIQGMIDSQK